MLEIAIDLIKRLWPYVMAGLVAFIIWHNGYQSSEYKWIELEAKRQAESNRLLHEANDRNEKTKQVLAESARIIGETYEENQKDNNAIVERNRSLLANRVRDESSRCKNTMPVNTSATSTSDDASTRNRSFLEKSGASLVTEAARADQVSESLRACQNYIKSLQEVFK